MPATIGRLHLGLITRSPASWPVWVCQAQDRFRAAGVEVRVSVAGSSDAQMAGFLAGRYDLVETACDHVIRARAGGHDPVILMAIDQPPFSLIAAPDVRNLADLRGRAIAVDGLDTGYALPLRRLLAAAGLPDGACTLVRCGGTRERFDALLAGQAAAAWLNPPYETILCQRGFQNLGRLLDWFPHYQGSVLAASAHVAQAHAPALVAYLTAYCGARRWLFAPQNRGAAADILAAALGVSAAVAAAAYDRVVAGGLLSRDGRPDPAGLRTVLDTMARFDQLTPPLPDPAALLALQYLELATHNSMEVS